MLHPQGLYLITHSLSEYMFIPAAADRPPADEFRNTPPETGVGGDTFQPAAPILNLVPFRCAKAGVWTLQPVSIFLKSSHLEQHLSFADRALHTARRRLPQHWL